MIKKIILPLILITSLLSACNNVDQNQLSIISPTGAPSLGIFSSGYVDNMETYSSVNIVQAELQSNKYDIVAFDFYNGLKTIKNSGSHYKLKKILTGGNVYLVGINKDEFSIEPKDDDLIVAFSQNSVVDLTFRNIYKDVKADYQYVSDNSAISPILLTGKFDNREVDYVVVAEPLLTKLASKIPYQYTKLSLREKWASLHNDIPYIYQAGLFINTDTFNNKNDDINRFLNALDQGLTHLVNNPLIIKNEMDKLSQEDQLSKFNFDSNTMVSVQKDSNNGFGFVLPETEIKIEKFLNILGIENTFKDYYYDELH